jgi:hypothetical protein
VPRCHHVPRRARPCGATVHDRADAARHPHCPANPRRPRCETARAVCRTIPPDQVHGSCRPPRSPDQSAVRTADQPSPLGTAPARDLPNRPAVPIIHRRQLILLQGSPGRPAWATLTWGRALDRGGSPPCHSRPMLTAGTTFLASSTG